MKKYVIFLLAGIIMSSVSITAFAQTSTGEDVGTDVKAKFVDGVETPEVCSVDVSWGSMEFTYSESGKKTWNPETHEYAYNTTSGWSANGNNVTVTNHSNKDIDVNVSFNALPEYAETISGEFDKSSFTLKNAVDSKVDNAPKDTVSLNLSGTIDKTLTDFTKVGSITVMLDN